MRLANVFIRSLAVQGAWNFERMVGVGIAHMSEPLLRDLPGGESGEAYGDALRRSASFFNTHPYLSGLAAAALARAEIEGVERDEIEKLRKTLVGPLGSIGDRLIWIGALPIAAAVAIALATLWPPALVPLVFMLLYNAAHFGMRIWGLRAGWENGIRVARALSSRGLKVLARTAGPLAGISVGFALPVSAEWLFRGWESLDVVGALLVMALGVTLVGWVFDRLDGLKFGVGAIGVVWMLGVLML
ncbi:MAG: PTS system mannose/fructose/sorbose family transporter subunit IID [Gemmatimonadales bacterium]